MEGQILLWLQENMRTDWLTHIIKFITSLSNGGVLWIVLAIVLVFIKKTRKDGFMLGVGLMLHLLLCNAILKNVFRRPRPYVEIEGLTSMLGKLSDYSFPSGHTAVTFMVAIILFKRFPKYVGISMYVLAVLTGFSRMYLGVHYPTDILGGAVLGTVIGLGAMYIVDKYYNKREEKEKLNKN